MNVLLVHPSALRYAETYLRLEPLGLECVAQALCQHGHMVRLTDLQVSTHRELRKDLRTFRPDVVGLWLNCLANVPEVIEVAKLVKRRLPDAFVFTGGQAGSMIADELMVHADGAIDAIVTGDDTVAAPDLLDAYPKAENVPGLLTLRGRGPRQTALPNLDRVRPARDLTRRRSRYFIGELNPCASIEFSRGRRTPKPDVLANEILDIHEPSVFILDDVALALTDYAMTVADEVEQRRIRKRFGAAMRADTLLSNEEVIERWVGLGLEAISVRLASFDEEARALNRRALEIARKYELSTTIELVADPQWDRPDFARAREWAVATPAMVHLTIATPYPGSELFASNERRVTSTDYRLYDGQHAVMATRLPLADFYAEFEQSQRAIRRHHLGWWARMTSRSAHDARLADHRRPVTYQLRRPERFPVQVLAATARQRMTSAVNGAT